MTSVADKLVRAVRGAAVFNPQVQAPPDCILWPDGDRRWEPVLARLLVELPELLVLGDYDPDQRQGPAIWLRCAIAGVLPEIGLPSNDPPILYLPGISRQDLRALESCPVELEPLVELQYRSHYWSQANTKDWTPTAFLVSERHGLGLDVDQDSDTRRAVLLSLRCLFDEQVEALKGRRLNRDFFNSLLTSGDTTRDLLAWLDQGDEYRETLGDDQWRAFVALCKSRFQFDPDSEGLLSGAEKLATHEGPWAVVWERYCEAPRRYPNLPQRIRKTTPPEDLFADRSGWPQCNEADETRLREELAELQNVTPHDARKRVIELDRQHSSRREQVWSELGLSPLAHAVEHFKTLAEITDAPMGGSVADLEDRYCSTGWHADDTLLRAVSEITRPDDLDAVSVALQAIYRPWADAAARHLQEKVEAETYPSPEEGPEYQSGECILFVDGLRFDTAKRLAAKLVRAGCETTEEIVWAALPSVTATGKPAVTPVRGQISGPETSTDFEPFVTTDGKSLKGGYHLKKLLKKDGWQVVEAGESGDPTGRAWCEYGDIDHEGHDRGWKLARHLDPLLDEVRERIVALLEAGWEKVHVVTDHGWLLLPGGLPKIDLPGMLTESKWGRCAAIKPGAKTDERVFPWYWNPHHYFALAEGISCYRKGEEYAHGGLSLQECLTLHLSVSSSDRAASPRTVEITDLVWKGLRCTIALDGNTADLILDMRTEPGKPESSVALAPKSFKRNNAASIVVENEELEGSYAFVVVIDPQGDLVAQQRTRIGEAE